MSEQLALGILPMKTAGTHHFIERTYRESGTYQWVRETFRNALEAGASKILYGIEWQAVDNLGVYRRIIADNGEGMSAEELVEFFNTFGGGGKPIGGPHENFGVGAKTSLLPWNRYGLIVVSWVDGEPAMIWVRWDEELSEYGLQVMEVEDPDTGDITLDPVYAPFVDEEHGCDWGAVKPDWIEDHGTVLILLGNDPGDDSVLGDPTRDEADIKGISAYLNRRIWSLPEIETHVDELRVGDKGKWPRSEAEAHGSQTSSAYDRRTNLRNIEGAKHFIEYPVEAFKKGSLKDHESVELADGTQVRWYLWSGERPAVQSYAAIGGFIAALYDGELYDVTTHAATYRSFGVTEAEVRRNLWLILRPPRVGENGGQYGVYPRTDRNSLLLRGGPHAGEPLPISDWGREFFEVLPEPIVEAVRAARGGTESTVTDPTWRERLQERFGAIWRIPKLRMRKGGRRSVKPIQPGSRARPRPVKKRKRASDAGGGSGGTQGETTVGSERGSEPASRTRVGGGLPWFRAVRAEDLSNPKMLASWQANDPDHAEGAVLLNVEHPVLEAEIERWQAMYPDHLADEIRQEVVNTYGEIAVSKVAHSEQLKGILASPTVENDLRSEAALTMALLGLMAEEAVISTRVGGKFGRKRRTAG